MGLAAAVLCKQAVMHSWARSPSHHHPLLDSFGVSSCCSLLSLWQGWWDLTSVFVSLDGKRSTRCVSSFRTGWLSCRR